MHWLLDLARDAEQDGRTVEASQHLEQLLDMDVSALVLASAAFLATDLEQYALATAFFERAVSRDPELAVAHSGWARALEELERPAEALERMRIALALRETSPRLVLFAVILQQCERHGEAMRALERALELEPDNEEALHNLAIDVRKTQPRRAVALLEQAIAIDGTYGSAHRELGYTLLTLGEMERAERHLRLALEREQGDAWAWVYLGQLQWDMKQFDEAGSSFAEAATLSPLWRLPLLLHGMMLDEIGERDRALLLLERAEVTDPVDGRAAYRLAEYWLRSNDHERALHWIQRCLTFAPDHPRATQLLAKVQRREDSEA